MIVEQSPIQLQFDPLSVVVNIEVVSGTLKQVHYSDSNKYTPNRALTPTYLKPSVWVIDPNGKILNGEKINQLSSGKWYKGSVTASNEITTKTSDSNASTADYAIGINYQLVIRKNINKNSPEQLFFVAAYYDTRRGLDVSAQDSRVLSTTSNAQSEAAPTLVLDKPSGYPFNPIDGLANFPIKAEMFRSGKVVPNANVKFWWYLVNNNIEHLAGSEVLDLCYKSGQNTAAIIVDPQFIGVQIIRCKAEYYTGTAPTKPSVKAVSAETKLIRRYPASLSWGIDAVTGNTVKHGDTLIKRRAYATINNNGEIPNSHKFCHYRWLHNYQTAGSIDVEVGHGLNLELPIRYAGGTSNTPGMIKLDVTLYSEFTELRDNLQNYIVDEKNNVIVGF